MEPRTECLSLVQVKKPISVTLIAPSLRPHTRVTFGALTPLHGWGAVPILPELNVYSFDFLRVSKVLPRSF